MSLISVDLYPQTTEARLFSAVLLGFNLEGALSELEKMSDNISRELDQFSRLKQPRSDQFVKAGQRLQRGFENGTLLSEDKVLVLGQSNTTWLKLVGMAQCFRDGQLLQIEDGNYDNILQELHRKDLDTYRIILLLPDSRKIYQSSQPEKAASAELEFWQQCWNIIREKSKATIGQVGYDTDQIGPQGLQLSSRAGHLRMLRELNFKLQDQIEDSDLFLCVDYLSGHFGKERFYDLRRYYWNKQKMSDQGLIFFCKYLSRAFRAHRIGGKKAIVLDLDNTLWGGVVGESGPRGIQLEEGSEGQAFQDFQRYVQMLGERGVFLNVASKNELQDAIAPFKKNPGMVLEENQLSSFKASWESKDKSIVQIADELHIGLDSVVFFDDDPVERGFVKRQVPSVEVIETPQDPADFISALETEFLFETGAVSIEDSHRIASLQADRARKSLRQQSSSLKDYLKTLEMEACVQDVNSENISRIEQLVGKTNQFNLTGYRWNLRQIQSASKEGVGLALSLKDKYSKYGLTGFLLIEKVDSQKAHIPLFLLSCRIIGRTAERFLMNEAIVRAKQQGIGEIKACYIGSSKNQQVANLYEEMGFQLEKETEGSKGYSLEVANYQELSTQIMKLPNERL